MHSKCIDTQKLRIRDPFWRADFRSDSQEVSRLKVGGTLEAVK